MNEEIVRELIESVDSLVRSLPLSMDLHAQLSNIAVALDNVTTALNYQTQALEANTYAVNMLESATSNTR